MRELLELVRTLRGPGGCPWDRRQTHASLRPHLLEEAAEAVDALTAGDDAAVREELGDVLLQVAFHAVLAEERGAFDYAAVERGVVDKMVRRHPHVFGEREGARLATDDAALNARWRAIKATEKPRRAGDSAGHPADRVPRSLPALQRAGALAGALGWQPSAARGGREDEGAEELGAALLDLALRARAAGLEPETLLRDATAARLRATADDRAR